MGLDMYAVRKLRVTQSEHESEDERYTVQVARGGKPVPGLQPDRVSAIEEDVMYWRKANHIHAWFVDNVQDGGDDCKEYYVDWDKLAELLSICKRVIEASKLVDGMIYAGTLYDKENPKGLVRRTAGKVIEDVSVAKELLPTRIGFFFGSYEYDETYLADVVSTHDWLVRMFADKEAGMPGEIYYFSSW